MFDSKLIKLIDIDLLSDNISDEHKENLRKTKEEYMKTFANIGNKVDEFVDLMQKEVTSGDPEFGSNELKKMKENAMKQNKNARKDYVKSIIGLTISAMICIAALGGMIALISTAPMSLGLSGLFLLAGTAIFSAIPMSHFANQTDTATEEVSLTEQKLKKFNDCNKSELAGKDKIYEILSIAGDEMLNNDAIKKLLTTYNPAELNLREDLQNMKKRIEELESIIKNLPINSEQFVARK